MPWEMSFSDIGIYDVPLCIFHMGGTSLGLLCFADLSRPCTAIRPTLLAVKEQDFGRLYLY